MASQTRSDGEGSVYKRHKKGCAKPKNARGKFTCNCKWQGSIVTGWRDGKRVTRNVTANTEAGVKNKLREIRADVDSRRVARGEVMTVKKWLTKWVEEVAEPNVRPSTLRGYRTSVYQWLIPLIGHHKLHELEPDHVDAAYRYLQQVGNPLSANPRPLSSTSAHQAHRALTRALTIAQSRKHLVNNVAHLVEYKPQPAATGIQVFTKAECEQILQAARERRDAARWSVALTAGLRQGEALALRWSDIDFDAGQINVERKLQRVTGKGLVFGPVKTKRGVRKAPLFDGPAADLRAHRIAQNTERLAAGSWWHDDDLVFSRGDGRPVDPKADWTQWKAVLEEAGLPSNRLHAARHSAATMMLAAGVPPRVAMDWLGHSQISVTMKYQHVVDQIHRDEVARVNKYLG